MEVKCKECGKPFPTGQDRCNWCDSGTTVLPNEAFDPYATPATSHAENAGDVDGPVLQTIGGLFKGVVVLFGLLLIAGGGLVTLCSGGGRAGDTIGFLSGLAIFGLGGWLIYFALTPKSAKKAASEPIGKGPETPDSPA